jgi:hypothetical protein
VLHDPFETTLVVRAELVDALPEPARRLDDRRVILLDGQLGDDLYGFMAAVSGGLGARGIWLLAIGAATRDHLLVAGEQLDDALDAIRALARQNHPPP